MIIGVIASLTIPSLKKSTQNAEAVAKVKKANAAFSNAIDLAQQIEGPIQTWGWGADAGNVVVLDKLVKYLNVEKNCGTGSGCWANVVYKFLDGTNHANYNTKTDVAKARLADGTSIYLHTQSNTCNGVTGTSEELKHVCGRLGIDINGNAPPNQRGLDVFTFWVTRDGVIPFGSQSDTNSESKISTCTSSGFGCTAWVLVNQNLKYMDGPISWE